MNKYSGIPRNANATISDPFDLPQGRIGGIPYVVETPDERLKLTASFGDSVLQITPPAIYAFGDDIWNLVGQPADGTGSSFDYATKDESRAGIVDNKPVAPDSLLLRKVNDAIFLGDDVNVPRTPFSLELQTTTTAPLTGTGSISIGSKNQVVGGDRSLAIGNDNLSQVGENVVLGNNNISVYSSSVIGNNNSANAPEVLITGNNNSANAPQAYIYGESNTTVAPNTIAVGNNNSCYSPDLIFVGYSNLSNAPDHIMIGKSNKYLEGVSTVATVVGYYNTSSGHTLGAYNTCAQSGIAIGTYNVCGQFGINLGTYNTSYQNTIAIGENNLTEISYAVTLGYNNTASSNANNGTAIGYGNVADGIAVTSIGYRNTSLQNESVAIGSNNTSSGAFSSTIGAGNSTNTDSAYASAIGYGNLVGIDSVYASAIGYGNTSSYSYAQSIGYKNFASGSQTTAIGYQTYTSGGQSHVFGRNVKNTATAVMELGYWSNSTTRSTGLRMDTNGNAAMTARKTDTRMTDGGATAGAEAVNALMRNGLTFRVSSSGALVADYNDAGTVKSVVIGTLA